MKKLRFFIDVTENDFVGAVTQPAVKHHDNVSAVGVHALDGV